jgi:uncharacterized surface anchored protein
MTRADHRTAVAFLILLVASAGATAQLQQLPRTRVAMATAKVESKTGEIRGRVVSENGQPLVNANVSVRPDTPEGLPVTNTTTNRDGVFKVTGLEPGSYTANAALPGYIPKAPRVGPAVQSTADSVTLVLIKGGVITGTVTNSKGDPVVAIGIHVEMVVDDVGPRLFTRA